MKKMWNWLHEHSRDIQMVTNLLTIVGMTVGLLQLSDAKGIINAIYDSQEKTASYRLLAMQTEIETNLEKINDFVRYKADFENGLRVFQIPLAIGVYFSSPTLFKFHQKNKQQNQELNEKISFLYANWQYANALIDANQRTLSMDQMNIESRRRDIALKNMEIIDIFEKTASPAAEVLTAMKQESTTPD